MKEFTVLTYAGGFVDETMLNQGLYFTDRPALHDLDDTIDKMVDTWMACKEIIGDSFEVGHSIENIKKCKLDVVELNFKI